MEKPTTPTGIEISNSEQLLEISWSDGHISKFPFYGLRKNCPCVVCRGGHGSMQVFDIPALFEQDPPWIGIKNLKKIGNHAIQIFWSDGHDSGMYSWDTLKWLDPANHIS